MGNVYKSEAGRQAIEAQYRRALERWPVPCEQRFVPTRHGKTFVVACGETAAPPLVLLHGSGANSSTWIRDVAVWAKSHRVFAVDMIGEPGLSAAARPALASLAYADWLEDVWTGLGIDTASVVGRSLGGWLGLDLAIRRPHRVTSLCLISPSGIGRQNAWLLAKVGLLRLCGTWGLMKSLALVSGSQVKLPPPMIDALLVVFGNFRPRMERIPCVSDADLAALDLPLLVIVGRGDPLLDSIETRRRVEAHVRGARVIVDDGGHILPPQTAVVASFLRGVESSTAAVVDASRATA